MSSSTDVSNSTNRRRFLKTVGGSAAITGFAGCLGGSSPSSNSEGGNTTQSERSVTATGNQSDKGGSDRNKNEFAFAAQQVVGTIDPAKYSDSMENAVVQNVYDALVWPEGKDMKKMLATDWEVNDAGDEFTFTLRDGVSFQTGNKLSAEDVKYSMDRMLRINQGFAWIFNSLLNPGNTEAVDEKTVRFKLQKPFASFVKRLYKLPIIDSTAAKNHEESGDYKDRGDYATAWLSENTAGAGPFELDTFTRESNWVFTRFNDYWEESGKNSIDTMNFKIIKDPSVTKTQIKAGEIDMTNWYLPPKIFKSLKKRPNINVPKNDSLSLFSIKMNNQKKPTDDKDFRKALAYAFDYSQARKEISYGASPAKGPIPPKIAGHNKDISYPSLNKQKAQKHLEKSQYSKDVDLDMMYISDNSRERQTALMAKSMYKDVLGIDMQLSKGPWARITSLASDIESTPNMTHVFQSPETLNPGSMLTEMYVNEGTWANMSWYHPDDVINGVKEAASITDKKKRLDKYREIQQRIMADQPDIYVLMDPHQIAMQKNVQGYEYEFLMADQRWNEWSK